MPYKDDPDAFRLKLKAKLQPAAIRATMEFAALYLMTHQQIEQIVRDKVREYYCLEFNLDGEMTARDRERYGTEVLSLAPKSPFKASLRRLVKNDALTQHPV